MIKVIRVTLDDLHWPNLSCQVGESIHQVQYDIAASQFEVHVNNALHKALRQMIHERKNPPAPLTTKEILTAFGALADAPSKIKRKKK